MELVQEHLDRVVCPVCFGRLTLGSAGIDCGGCGRRYPVVDGLPVLIASRAVMVSQS